jgi:glycosyltransferase involved in cell wall biosynthesis
VGKTGWPWTEETPQVPTGQPPGSDAWPQVSIVTPSFNQGGYIEETIRSVLLQAYPDLNYIIIDGGSKDDSVAIIRKYEKWLGFWISEPDEGCTNAVNKGFSKATGKLMGIMCADDYYMPGGILTLVRLRSEKPDSVAWVGGCPDLDPAGKVVNAGQPLIRDPKEMGDWGVGGWFAGVACLFSADAFRSLGGFDERFKTSNDVELWLRLAKIGSFTLTNDHISSARLNPDSLSHRDWPGEVTALIAMNYMHGYRTTAKTILARHVADQLSKSPQAPCPAAEQLALRTLSKALVKRLIFVIKKRVFQLFRLHQEPTPPVVPDVAKSPEN